MANIYPVTIPKWGIEMQEGTVTEWRVAVGDTVSKGDELIDIESDKIVNTMEAPVTGVLKRTIAEVDDTLKVGQLLGIIADDSTAEEEIDAFISGFVPADASFGVDSDDEVAPTEGERSGSTPDKEPEVVPRADHKSVAGSISGQVKVSPVAKRLAAKLGVDLSTVTGTGRNGRISTEDVEKAAEGSSSGTEVVVSQPLNSRALTAARRLVESKQNIPHFYLQRDLDLRAALAAKDRDNVPMTALLLKALGGALVAQPQVNAHLVDDALHPQSGAAINVAVDTPDGLVAPLLAGIDSASVADIAHRLRALAAKARDKQLGKDDLAPGGTTLSNLGMFGISEFSAIINPPQVAILAVGTVRPLDLGEGPVPAMTATLSCDHRAIDGASGARFLAAFQAALNDL